MSRTARCPQIRPRDTASDGLTLAVGTTTHPVLGLLLSCAKRHTGMLPANRRQPHLLHVSAVDRRQTWSMDKS